LTTFNPTSSLALLLDYPKERSALQQRFAIAFRPERAIAFPNRTGDLLCFTRNAIAFSKQTGDQLGSGVLAPSKLPRFNALKLAR
jgi:hypothetical protein